MLVPMDRHQALPSHELATVSAPCADRPRAWEAPRVEVISLCCEITAYAPDDQPLF
jgi:hypothetical protein